MIDPIIDHHQRDHNHHHQIHLTNYQPHQSAIIDTLNQQHFHQQRQHQQPGHELIGYYFGSISRDTAEWILRTYGNSIDGAYLLRSSGPNDDFVLSLLVVNSQQQLSHQTQASNPSNSVSQTNLEVLHYKIVETEDSFVALHGQIGDEKFSTIDDLIDKAQGIATKPRWPILRQTLDSQILPPTYWGLSVDQVRLAILIKAKQWSLPILSPAIQISQQQDCSPAACSNQQQQQHSIQLSPDPPALSISPNVTTLYNETIRTLIYKSLHEFQPWFHGKITREEAERRIRVKLNRDGRFLVRERDNNSYAMCINHKKTPKHYRIDVLPTGEIAIQDGRKFTSLMALVSHYTIMNDGLWCALTEACPRPIATTITPLIPQPDTLRTNRNAMTINALNSNPLAAKPSPNHLNQLSPPQSICYLSSPPNNKLIVSEQQQCHLNLPAELNKTALHHHHHQQYFNSSSEPSSTCRQNATCSQTNAVPSLKGPIKVWLHSMNHKLSQFIATKPNQQQSMDSFLFSTQKDHSLSNHCKKHERVTDQYQIAPQVKCKSTAQMPCGCINQPKASSTSHVNKQKLDCEPNTAKIASPQVAGVILGGDRSLKAGYSTRTNDNNSYGMLPNQSSHSYHCCSSGAAGMVTTNYTNPGEPFLQENHLLSNGPSLNGDQSSLISNWTQNTRFNLISQSIIGSPLFAVKQTFTDRLQPNETEVNCSGSSNNSESEVEEEKLISPVHSVIGVNTAYNLNHDIYSSQTSTALINDSILNSSSSSSSSTNHFASNNKAVQNKMSHLADIQNLEDFNTYQGFTSNSSVNKVKKEIDLMDWSENHAFDLKLISNSLYKPPSPDQICESNYDSANGSSVLSSILPESKENEKQLIELKKKHDLDDITTALLAELTASLKAQVELNNKRCGFVVGLHNSNKNQGANATRMDKNNLKEQVANPLELINEFDTLISK